MGQINASLGGPDGRSGGDHRKWSAIDGTNIGPSSLSDGDLMDENKKKDLKAMHCVKNRIDMLIEDCLNIKQIPDERKVEVNEKTKDDEVKTENVQLSSEQNVNEDVKHNESPKAESITLEGVDKPSSATNDVTQHPKHVEKIDKKSPNEDSPDKVQENPPINNSVKDLGPLKTIAGDKQSTTQKKKTITTFQKFIDEVFDNSLNVMQQDEVNSASNFLKLCSDSLKTDTKLNVKTKDSVESDKLRKEETKPKIESPQIVNDEVKPKLEKPNNKEITLKDHIERFLEASFREENTDVSTNSTATPKNLNIHMLVNDMITRGLKLTNTDTQPTQDGQANIQARTEPQKETQAFPQKRNDTQIGDFKQKTSTIEVPGERISMVPGLSFNEKSHDSKNMHNNAQTYTNSAYSKAHLQGAPHMTSRDNFKSADNSSRLFNVRERHDPFDPRFADPKFQDNRIDIVPHEVNAQSIRETQLDRRTIPKPEPNTGPMPLGLQAIYRPRSPYQAGPSSSYSMSSRGSPSSQYSNDRFGAMGRSNVHTVHHAGCKCPSCLSQSSQIHLRDQHAEHQQHQRSPNYITHGFSPADRSVLAPMGSANIFNNDPSATMIRPSHSTTLTLGQSLYPQSSPKLIPQRSPIGVPMERYGRSLSATADHIGNFNMPPRHPSNSVDYYNQGLYLTGRRGDSYTPPAASDKYSRPTPEDLNSQSKVTDRNSNSVRPSTLPPKEHFNNCQPQGIKLYPDHGMPKTIKHVETTETDTTPLDLTVKKANQGIEHQRQYSSSGTQQSLPTSQTKLSPTLTFIKHLENSVDKYCQELISPPSPNLVSRHVKPQAGRRSISPNDRRSPMVGYAPSPHGISPQGLYPSMLQNRPLPSPHFSGGITMGQPLVDKSQTAQQQTSPELYGMNNAQTSVSVQAIQQSQQAMVQTQSGFMAPVHPQGNFDPAGKRGLNNVSKHEPIQNIIGNHDSNDILYLYCKVCASTYGSLYGFRKHFRNQHGFEPRPEHTIVHTISGTKSALHIPASVPVEAIRQCEKQMIPGMLDGSPGNRSVNNFKDHVVYDVDESKRASESPQDASSNINRGQNKGDAFVKQKNFDQIEKITEEGETKFLECPECGKTFQLNDFGSYKRHCRQHGHIKPFGCTDCQRSFMDQRGLKEHYKVHIKESQLIDGNKSDSSSSVDVANYLCNKCDKSFFNSAQFDSHMASAHQRSTLKSGESNTDISESKTFAQTKGSPISEVNLPEMTQRISTTRSIVKQAAESMTVQVCPDSSWDEADRKTQTSSEISNDNNYDSGYSSSVGSNVSQAVEDSSCKKLADKDIESQSGKQESEKNESSEGNYEVYYKHKKFFHPRKRESSVSMSSNDATPSKVSKGSDMSPSPGGNTSVISSTVYTNTVFCDSQSVDSKVPDVVTADSQDTDSCKLDKVDKPVLESGDCKTTEARHNLPYVWDRATRSRKTK